jgi:hypothetical protein
MYCLVMVDSTQFTAHWNKSEIPLSKKIALYDTVPLLLESNALSRQHQIYWFCRQCWQTMDIYNLNRCSLSPSLSLVRELGLKKQHSFFIGGI